MITHKVLTSGAWEIRRNGKVLMYSFPEYNSQQWLLTGPHASPTGDAAVDREVSAVANSADPREPPREIARRLRVRLEALCPVDPCPVIVAATVCARCAGATPPSACEVPSKRCAKENRRIYI